MADPLIGLTRNAFNAIGNVVNGNRRNLSPQDRARRRQYPGGSSVEAYIVTQLNVDDENAYIVRDPVLAFGSGPSYPTFKAQPWDKDDTSFSIGVIDHDLDEDISSTAIAGVLFTGQVFLVANGFAIGGDGHRFRGTLLQDLDAETGGVLGISGAVEVKYLSNCSTDQTCEVVAINETGMPLTTGQEVIIDLMNHAWSTTSRFRISEVKCPS